MGFVSLHFNKTSGNDAAMSAHIERTIHPKNADEHRTHLNRELIEFPEGVTNRTDAIQHRIETAGIKRKIGKNQVRAVRAILSGTHEDLEQIQKSGRLNEWCDENLDWLRKTFGAENLVSAVLHLDEKSPHIHATIVPIVSGERRKAKQAKPTEDKKTYRKKSPDSVRLCADDIMNRAKFIEYQDSYAEQMQRFGMQRGMKGSEANHITAQQYNRTLQLENEDLKEKNECLQEEKNEVYEKVRDLYDRKDEAEDKFLVMDGYVRKKSDELAIIETKLQKAKKDYEPYKVQEELNLIHELFPMMKEQLRIATFCRKIGLAIETIKSLLEGKSLTAKSFSFFSPEHNHKFTAEDVRLKIEKEPDNPNKLRLNINGMNILDWFRQKYQEFQMSIGINIKPRKEVEIHKSKGIKR
jgi:FtsZ-binding cell division protein ZapB